MLPSAAQIIDKLKIVYRTDNETEIALRLGVNRGTFGSWKCRDSFQFEVLSKAVSECSVSWDWFLLDLDCPPFPPGTGIAKRTNKLR